MPVDRREETAGVASPAASLIVSGQAQRCAKLPRQSFLPARPAQRLLELLLGRAIGRLAAFCLEKLAPDAQDLGDAPEFFVSFAHAESLVDDLLPLGNAVCEPQSVGIFRIHPGVAQREAVLRKPVQRRSKQIQTAREIALFDQQYPLKAFAPGMPDRQTFSNRAVEQEVI